MSHQRSSPESNIVVHHAAPRVVIYACMPFLALIVLPAYVLEPRRLLEFGNIFGLLVFLAFETLLAALAQRRVVLSVDSERQVLTIRGLRWPLAEQSHRIPIDDVADVIKQRAPRSRAVRLALALRSGTETPLTPSYFGDGSRMERDAAAIRRLCGLPETIRANVI
jgi:hypothetical protein